MGSPPVDLEISYDRAANPSLALNFADKALCISVSGGADDSNFISRVCEMMIECPEMSFTDLIMTVSRRIVDSARSQGHLITIPEVFSTLSGEVTFGDSPREVTHSRGQRVR